MDTDRRTKENRLNWRKKKLDLFNLKGGTQTILKAHVEEGEKPGQSAVVLRLGSDRLRQVEDAGLVVDGQGEAGGPRQSEKQSN